MEARLLLVFSIVTFAYGQTADEETAIKKLLEKESATWRAKDVTGHAECWHIQPYSRILVFLSNGTTIDLPPSVMKNQTPHSMGNGGAAVNSNYKMSIRTNTAWVSHDELSTDRNG